MDLPDHKVAITKQFKHCFKLIQKLYLIKEENTRSSQKTRIYRKNIQLESTESQCISP